MGVAKILKLFGLYKVNDAYLASVNEKLEVIEGDLGGIGEIADSGSQIIDALNAGDKPTAVKVAMEFCKIDDEVKELQEIQKKVKAGEAMEAAIAAADGPALTKEIVESVMREVADHYEKVTGLIPNIAAAGEEVAKKVSELPSAAASWSLAEKIGTPEAAHNTAKKAKAVKDGAADVKTKLEALKKSLEGLKK
jgi:hypothetical protein